MTDRPGPLPRTAFAHLETLTTRWADNDVYGHLNNVVHYALFDTAVNRFLVRSGALDIHHGPAIGLVVHTECDYFDALAFPQIVHAGLRVRHCGTSSVDYEIGLFGDDAPSSAARGRFVHVYVDRATRRPVPLSAELQRALQPLRSPAMPAA